MCCVHADSDDVAIAVSNIPALYERKENRSDQLKKWKLETPHGDTLAEGSLVNIKNFWKWNKGINRPVSEIFPGRPPFALYQGNNSLGWWVTKQLYNYGNMRARRKAKTEESLRTAGSALPPLFRLLALNLIVSDSFDF